MPFEKMPRRRARQAGQAIVEFAIMLPLLLLLLLGGADLLMAISAHQQVSYVAQETAQWCLVNVGVNAPCSAAPGQAQTFASQVGLINASRMSAAPNSCPLECVSVTASYSFVPIFPFFPSFTMTSTAQAFMPTTPGT